MIFKVIPINSDNENFQDSLMFRYAGNMSCGCIYPSPIPFQGGYGRCDFTCL